MKHNQTLKPKLVMIYMCAQEVGGVGSVLDIHIHQCCLFLHHSLCVDSKIASAGPPF